MGKCGCFFLRATTLVAARKSQSSGVRGLVVWCLLFNPEGSCSNPWVCAIFLQVFRSRRFTFSVLWDSPFFRLCETFFRKFFYVLKRSSLQFVLIFCNRTNFKKSQRVPSFRFFGTMRLLKILIFCFLKIFQVKKISKCPLLQFSALWDFSNRIIFVLKLGFLRPSTLYPIFVFFKDRCFFYATFFLICFHRSPLNFY